MGPPAFIEAMRRDPAARRAFAALPETERADCIAWINAGPAPTVVLRRVVQVVARLAAGRAWNDATTRPR